MIKAVIFDVDGVLINSLEATTRFYQDLFGIAGYTAPTKEKVASNFHLSMKDFIGFHLPHIGEEEVSRIWSMGRDRVVRYPDEMLTLFAGVDETLYALSREYSLAIVTSRVQKTKNAIFNIPPLQKFRDIFSEVVSYEDTVNHKPHPEPLLLCCERLGIQPHEGVYVGDTFADVEAAQSAGMPVIAFTQNAVGMPNAQTNIFSSIPALIEKIATEGTKPCL